MTTCVFADSATPLSTLDDARAAARRVNRGRRDKRRVAPVRCGCCAQYYLSLVSRDLRWARQQRHRARQTRHAALSRTRTHDHERKPACPPH